MGINYLVENGTFIDRRGDTQASINGRLEVMSTNYIKGNLTFQIQRPNLRLDLPIMGAVDLESAVMIINPFKERDRYGVILVNGQTGILKSLERKEISLPHDSDNARTFFTLNSVLSNTLGRTLGGIYLPFELEEYQ